MLQPVGHFEHQALNCFLPPSPFDVKTWPSWQVGHPPHPILQIVPFVSEHHLTTSTSEDTCVYHCGVASVSRFNDTIKVSEAPMLLGFGSVQ